MSGDAQGPVRPGLRILRGSNLTIPAGGLVISADGGMEVREVLLSTATWLEWLHIAVDRLAEAKDARRRLVAAVANSEEENEALVREVRASLQVVTSAVFSLDGFYDHLQEHVVIPQMEREARVRNRAGRAVWVLDAIFRLARIPNASKRVLNLGIKTCYQVRDLAVHPEHQPRQPQIHRGLNQAVPSYVATFSVETCLSVIALCAEAILWVLDHPQAQDGPVFELGKSFSGMFHDLIDPHMTYAPDSPLRPRSSPAHEPTSEGEAAKTTSPSPG